LLVLMAFRSAGMSTKGCNALKMVCISREKFFGWIIHGFPMDRVKAIINAI